MMSRRKKSDLDASAALKRGQSGRAERMLSLGLIGENQRLLAFQKYPENNWPLCRPNFALSLGWANQPARENET